MAIPGDWTLFYDWGCDGGYGQTPMSITADGRWTNGEGSTGPWVQQAGMLTFTFDNSETTYAGNVASQSITGMSTTFSGLDGCFYMLQAGVPTTFAAEAQRAAGKADSGGRS
jgi:hypothetical protein